MKKTIALTLVLAAASLAHADPDYRKEAIEMVKRDFQPRGIAGLDRLNNDAVQTVCNQYANQPPTQIVALLQKDQHDAVKYPADGKFMGDWKAGEKLAQSGAGLTWTDKLGTTVGGNCYNCHRLSPSEIAYGTLGPSLLQFGKLRGDTPDVQRYVYTKIYNAKIFNLCSNMPRFGYAGALSEKQIKDLVALLLDPESPVNKEPAVSK